MATYFTECHGGNSYQHSTHLALLHLPLKKKQQSLHYHLPPGNRFKTKTTEVVIWIQPCNWEQTHQSPPDTHTRTNRLIEPISVSMLISKMMMIGSAVNREPSIEGDTLWYKPFSKAHKFQIFYENILYLN